MDILYLLLTLISLDQTNGHEGLRVWMDPKFFRKPAPQQKLNIILTNQHAHLDTLNLLRDDIKLFAGHCLNLLRSKCPGVNETQIHLILSYISKGQRIRTSSLSHLSNKGKKFETMLSTIRACTTGDNTRRISGSHYYRWGKAFTLLRLQAGYFGLSSILNELSFYFESVSKLAEESFYYVQDIALKGKPPVKREAQFVKKDGSDSFKEFLALLWELYIKACPFKAYDNLYFQAAAHDLFGYLTHDRITTEKAAKYFLNSDFIRNVTLCADGL